MIQRLIEYFENRELQPIDEEFLRSLLPTIMEIIRTPSSNPPAAAVLALIAVTLLIIVVLALVQVLGRGKDEDDEYEYVLVDEYGNEVAVAASAVEIEQSASAPARRRDPLRYQKTVLAVLGVLAVLLVAAEAGSRSRAVCLSCHEGAPHTAAASEDAHRSVLCVDCHSSPGSLSALVLTVPVRTAHIVAGSLTERNNWGLGPVPGSACRGCHESITHGPFENPRRGLRMSHREPLEAGAACRHCHALDDQGRLGRETAGMGVCLRCHNSDIASADCSVCHVGDVSLAALSTVEHEPRRIIAQPDCYSCHQPAACDACHGVRLPHALDYRQTHMMDAARDIWFNRGRVCFSCHTETRNSCYQLGCHANELDFHRGEDPDFPRNHGEDPEWTCDSCHTYAASFDDPCSMCHKAQGGR